MYAVRIQQSAQSRSKIQNVIKTLKNIAGYDEAVDALVLGLVAREDVMLVGPRGTAFTHLVWTLARLVQAQLTTTTSAEEWPHDNVNPSRLVFIEIVNATLPPRLIEKKNAWILIVAANEEAFKGEEMSALYDRFVKAYVQRLDGRDLLSAVKAVWLSNYKPIASMEDVEVLHRYAISLLRQEDIIESYYENMAPFVELLRMKRIAVSDEHVINTLPKLYAAYLAIHGVSPENMISATYDAILHVAQSREELQNIKEIIDESYGETINLIHLLSDGRQLFEIGDVRTAWEVFQEVASHDVRNLPPNLRQKAEVLISAANEYIKKIQKIAHIVQEGA